MEFAGPMTYTPTKCQQFFFRAAPILSHPYFPRERATGHGGNNILTVLMSAKKIDLQAASDCVGVFFKDLADRYLLAKTKLPSWGPGVDEGVARYVEGVAHWIRGNIE